MLIENDELQAAKIYLGLRDSQSFLLLRGSTSLLILRNIGKGGNKAGQKALEKATLNDMTFKKRTCVDCWD